MHNLLCDNLCFNYDWLILIAIPQCIKFVFNIFSVREPLFHILNGSSKASDRFCCILIYCSTGTGSCVWSDGYRIG